MTEILQITGSHSQGAGAGTGAGRNYVGGFGLGTGSSEVGHARYGYPELGVRSASVPQVRMRCECDLKNYACDC
eukprot:2176344-Pleurochrysis_carterae.AAC.1